MAELVFTTLGRELGARVAPAAFRAFGAALGGAGGAVLGRSIDTALFGETRSAQGPRLSELHVQGASEGAPIPAVYGRVRIAGQVIWVARFKETQQRAESGGGKGGPSQSSAVRYTYSLSFAVGLCEGEIAGLGRVWANGEPFDLSRAAYRLYFGGEDQEPDPLIESIEGAAHTPAYRGLAYIVFEDLPLAQFGDAIPQLSFEIVRQAPPAGDTQRLEQRVRGVCLIPGAGEFVYADRPVTRILALGEEITENAHASALRANFEVSLDQLARDLPACESVLLVTAWFGTDLRCGVCEIKPGVETLIKETDPLVWRAGGVERAHAHLISQIEEAPAFGGTPSDETIIQAIQALKARGYRVGLYPFVLMDVPTGNARSNPYGGAAQPAYPWRGRITLHPAPGRPGSPDKSSAAAGQVNAFFGDAAADDFTEDGDTVSYHGPAEWSYRRFILHNARLAQAAGGIDAFIIGSELRGLTTARDDDASFPAVAQLRALAGDVRAIVGDATTLTYAADWSEYFGHHPRDGSGDVYFHLDPLWADDSIDVIGVDWYPPLTDWRDGGTHADALLAQEDHDPVYLESCIEAGEAYDWFYADDDARAAQSRTPITDGAYDEPWIYRAKDLRNFWSRAHYNRPGGVRASSPTDWVPKSKPIWLVELGIPAIDKGANAPNLFVDPKSSESAVPPFSNGARDDLIQRRALEAYLRKWDPDGGENPTSGIYDGPMIDPGGTHLWCWDTRPHPHFPAREDVWADGPAWSRGHWLNGRAGATTLGDVVSHICLRAGIEDCDASILSGVVAGYVLDAPASARAGLEPLMAAYGFDAREREGRIVFFHTHVEADATIARADFTEDSAAALHATRADPGEKPIELRVRFIDAAEDYRVALIGARRQDGAIGVETLDAPLVLEPSEAQNLAERILSERRARNETRAFGLSPVVLDLEPGDVVAFAEAPGDRFEIVRIEDGAHRQLELRRVLAAAAPARAGAAPSAPTTPNLSPQPFALVLDLPLTPERAPEDERPRVALFAKPWRGAHEIHAGASDAALSLRARIERPAILGELAWALWSGPVDRWDEGNVVRIRLKNGALSSATRAALLNGANRFAVEGANGDWEILQAQNAVLTAPNEYELSTFLRGQFATAHAMRAPHPVGAAIVLLDDRLAPIDIAAHEWGEPLTMICPPAGGAPSDARARRFTVTLPRAAAKPWPPTRLAARRDGSGDVTLSWIRRARFGGDSWGAGEPPLGPEGEHYRLDILDGETLVRSLDLAFPNYLYALADQIADFGAPPAALRVQVAQLDARGTPGLKTDSTITL